uniref:Uncharacterized protein n=1 Tax=Romanomermis culicivorax TaxID=13658 RepID=A0A915HU16_ROMCU
MMAIHVPQSIRAMDSSQAYCGPYRMKIKLQHGSLTFLKNGTASELTCEKDAPDRSVMNFSELINLLVH